MVKRYLLRNPGPSCDVIIYDGHSCIQVMDVPQISGPVMFEEMARQYIHCLSFYFIMNKMDG